MSSCHIKAQTPEEHITQFFKEYASEGAGKALDNLYATNPWISQSGDAVINLKNNLNSLTKELVGSYVGKELIVKRTIGESYVLYSYMVKYERQPFRFTFQYYKPRDNWMIFGFFFDDQLDDELEESAKLQMIKSTYNR